MGVFLRPELNLIQKKDLHTRRELWKQKVKLLDLKKFDKDFWDKSYEFLPLPKTYQRIRDKVKAWIDANKNAESKYLELQKQVGEELMKLAQIANGQRREEDELGLFEPEERPEPDLARLKELRKGALALQKNNWKGLERTNQESIQSEEITQLIEEWKEIKDYLREPCSILWHENNWIRFVWHNSTGADLGLEKYGFLYRNKLYFIDRFVYIDNAKLVVIVEAKVDLIYLYYGNFLRGQGTIKISEAPLFLEDKNLCYSFCQDLSNVKLLETRGDWQPRYKCMYFDLTSISSGNYSQMDVGTGEIFYSCKSCGYSTSNQVINTCPNCQSGDIEKDKDSLEIPIDLQPNTAGWMEQNAARLKENKILAFLCPSDYYKDRSVLYRKFSKTKPNGEGDYQEIALPADNRGNNLFSKYPHLIRHCSVQVFFLNKLIHQGFLNQFQLREETQTNPDGFATGTKHYLQYLLQIKANPSGIYYYFKSDSQIWKTEVAVSRIFRGGNFFQQLVQGAANFFRVGDVFSAMGIEGGKEEKTEEEEQGRRIYKATTQTRIKKIQSALLYANKTELKYDFFGFANRYTYPFIKWRFSISQNHLNSLENSNNYSHLLNINTTFNSLGSLIKKGFWKAELNLKTDSDDFIKGIFSKGVNFYEDLENDFPNPVLKNTNIANVNVFDTDDSSIIVGEESLSSQSFTHQISYQADRREYDYATYFGFSVGSENQRFRQLNSALHAHSDRAARGEAPIGFCWGCSYDSLRNSNFLRTNFTPQVDCDFVYCLETGATPTTRPLTAGTNYMLDFTPTDILISWTVYSRTTEAIETPTINPDSLQGEPQPDNEEPLEDIDDLEENEGEEELSEGEQQEDEETESESSDDEEEVEESEEETEDEEDEEEESSEESEDEEEESSEDDEDDDEESEEE